MSSDAARATPPLVFISYSHKDKKYLAQLRVFLKPLERVGAIECWDDTRIDPGGRWKRAIADAIETAAAAVLLVSADFLASDFIAKDELPPLLEAAEKRGLAVLPVIVRPCGFTNTPAISRFQAVNDPSQPLAKLSGWKREEVWTRLTAYVQSTLSQPRQETAVAAPATGEGADGASAVADPPPSVLPIPVPASIGENAATQVPLPSEEVGLAYRVDSTGLTAIPDGTTLYKLASLIHADPGRVLSGQSGLVARTHGRFHFPQQLVTYCSDNVLTAIAEVLCAMRARVMQRLRERAPLNVIRASVREERSLAILPVREIDRLAYLESPDIQQDLRVVGNSFLVSSEREERAFQDLANHLRERDCRGVVYPSARHSRGHCIAFFTDQTRSLKVDEFVSLLVTIQLVAEDFDPASVPRLPDPTDDVIDSGRGYYSFADEKLFREMDRAGRLRPRGLPVRGTVDLLRRFYRRYPADAVGEQSGGAARVACPINDERCPYRD